MSKHKCDGLSNCWSHPRWHVVKARWSAVPRWVVYGPNGRWIKWFYSQEKAFACADAQARKDNAVTSE